MRYLLLLLTFSISAITSSAQVNYDADLIPVHLLSRANAVIRNEETWVDMRAADNVIYKVKQAITILNKNGESSAQLELFYDKNTNIKNVKGEIYNAVGKLETKFTLSDFIDLSAVSDFSLYEDTRIKQFLPNSNSYPYTVVYQYEIRFKQNLIIPTWRPKPADDVSVEESVYTFVCKPNDKFRIKTQSLQGKAVETSNETQKVLMWKMKGIPSLKLESYSPTRDTYETFVKIAPDNFYYYSHEGNYNDWNGLGKWIYDDLLNDSKDLPIKTVETIKELVKLEKSDKEKAKKIYQYFQDKTRYISIQIGIGGFKPFSAADVDRLGYGDCKALVNYMQRLLKVVNIESYYCIVNAGNEQKSLDISFASMNQANHVILCLPFAGDTTWLECTSQTIPFGFLSNFTDDRVVLACRASGGKLLRTPKYTALQNLRQRTAQLFIDKNGNVNGEVSTLFKGLKYDDHIHVQGKIAIEQQKMLIQIYPIDNISFQKIEYFDKKDVFPELQEHLTLNIRNYGALNNDKIFLTINPFPIKISLQEIRNRTMPIFIDRGYTDEDKIIYTLAEEIIPQIAPQETLLQTQFGTYEAKTNLKGNVITHYRKFTLNEGKFTVASYPEFVKFINDVNAADQFRYVLKLK